MRKNKWSIEGQLDLFEYMKSLPEPTKEQLSEASNVLDFKSRKEQVLSSAEEYLKKGERLTTLARKKYGRMIERLSFSEVEEKLFTIKLTSRSLFDSVVPKIATTVVRPLLRGLTTCDKDDKYLSMLKSLVDYDIELHNVDMESEGWQGAVKILKRVSRKSNLSESQLCLTLKEERYKPLTVYGLKDNAHPKNRKNVLFKDSSVCGDIAEIMAWLICFTQYNRALVNKDLEMAIRKSLYEDSILIDPMEILYMAIVKGNGDEGQWVDGERNMRNLYEKHAAFLSIPLQNYRQPSESAIKEICFTLGVDYEQVIRDHGMSKTAVRDRNRLQISADGTPYMYVLNNELDLAFNLIDPLNWVKTERGKLCYHDFLNKVVDENYRQENDPDYIPDMWSEPKWNSGIRGAVLSNMEKVLELVFEDYKEKVKTLDYLKETKSRAKVYQTKKNIPEKVIKEMQESILNDYFGYVEFDEECDLEKVGAITDEFIAFKETYLKKLDTKKVSIRFRKLGNYKAAGLYFPEIGCLCVDFRYPDSFVHEYGHCIDNTHGGDRNLSEENEFYEVFYAYRRAFTSALSQSGRKLKGKYNTDYYLQKTEVFARCFEMYIVRTLEMTNSICKPDSETSFAYPQDDALMGKINEYFGKLFAELNESSEEVAA